MTPHDPLPIGIVGLNFGRYILRTQLGGGGPATPWFKLAAVCSMDPAATERAAAEFGTRAVHRLDDLLADPDIPVIGLFTGPVGRADLLRRCIRAGKHVMTTKPLELDPHAALDVLQEARRLGRHIHLNSPAAVLPDDLAIIRQWQQEHDLGLPVACRAETWCRYREQPDGSWYDDPRACPAAPIFRLGIYLINDLAQFFGPAKAVQVTQTRVFTARPTADQAQLTIEYHSGAIAGVFASFCVGDGQRYRNALVMNFERGTVYRNVGPHGSDASDAEAAPPRELALVRPGHPAVYRQFDTGSGHYAWDVLARSIRGGDVGEVLAPHQVVAGLQVIEAMRRALASGRTEPVHELPASAGS